LEKGTSSSGISIYGSKNQAIGLSWVGSRIELWRVEKGVFSVLATEEFSESKKVTLFLENRFGQYCRFGFIRQDGQKQQIGTLLHISSLPQWDRLSIIGIHTRGNGTGIFDEVGIFYE
jgi:hypothetical protein